LLRVLLFIFCVFVIIFASFRVVFFLVFFLVVFLIFFLVFVFLFVLREFVCIPGFVAKAGVGDTARIDDNSLRPRLKVGATEIERSGLESIKKKSGGLVVNLMGEKQAHDLHEGDLDGVGVFEDGQVEGMRRTAGAVGIGLGVALAPLIVKVTELTVVESWGTALDSVDLDVLTTSDTGWIEKVRTTHETGSYPPPPRSFGIKRLPGDYDENL